MNTLPVGAESPWIVQAGAATILFVHIAGGSVGIVSGLAALAVRKGSRAHALAGRAFLFSMMAMASVGALVAPFLLARDGTPKMFDSIAGFFTFYLVVTGWLTMRRKPGTIGRGEVAAFVFAASLAAATFWLGTEAAARPSGAAGGFGSSGYYGLATIIALAAALDLKVILAGGIAGPSRLARHLWRMCLALFVAVGSFFLGQQRVMPEFVQGSAWLQIPPLVPLAMMVFWLLRLRLARPLGWLRKKWRARRERVVSLTPAAGS